MIPILEGTPPPPPHTHTPLDTKNTEDAVKKK